MTNIHMVMIRNTSHSTATKATKSLLGGEHYTNEMPAFPSAKTTEAIHEVTKISDYRCCYGINNLTPQ